jgi:hypothetical protein
MAYNEELTNRVRKLLIGPFDIKEIKMFGSIGFKVNDKLCMGVGNHADHIMMVRVGLDAYPNALLRKGANPAIMRGKERKGYVFLLEDAVRTDKDLQHWIDLALAYNKELTGI